MSSNTYQDVTLDLNRTLSDRRGPLAPADLFVLLLGQAISSGAEILAETGMDDVTIWTHYRAALNLVAQSTLEIDHPAIAA